MIDIKSAKIVIKERDCSKGRKTPDIADPKVGRDTDEKDDHRYASSQ